MLAVVRSELVRLRRPRLLIVWAALMAVFAMMINLVMFSTALGGSAPASDGPGVTFPDAATLVGADGLVAGLSAAASIFGVVTLSFWAMAAGSDYGTGVIRLLVCAQPRRWRLLAGKALALVVLTAGASAVATVVNVMVAPVAARSAGLETDAWLVDPLATILPAYVNLLAAMCVWGVLGLVLAVLLRSSAIAISIGIGYVLVVESLIRMASSPAPDWLLGTTLSALASGGNAQVGQGAAVMAGVTYVAVGLVLATVVFARRDITD